MASGLSNMGSAMAGTTSVSFLHSAALVSVATAEANSPFCSADTLTGGNLSSVWEHVDADRIAKKRRNNRQLFHNGRHIQIRHLPRDATEEEIRSVLSQRHWEVQSVHLMNANGPGTGFARVYLRDPEPEFWDAWPSPATTGQHQQGHKRDAGSSGGGQPAQPYQFNLRGQKVTLNPSPTDNCLCVAKLPLDVNEVDFKHLAMSYGEIRKAFLMISEETGESKGYGFIEYCSKEAAMHAKSQLETLVYGDSSLTCDWLDHHLTSYEDLHSKVLYVDNLPKDFRDMSEFRSLFSVVAPPPYCQIALNGGIPQNWGLVEFSNSEDAEETWQALNGTLFHGSRIRVSFFIPGVRAISIYMRLLNETVRNKGREALLPEPPAETVFHQLQNLTKQNPGFVQSLHQIIMTQIQSLQEATPASHLSANDFGAKHGPRGRGPSPPLGSLPPTSSALTSAGAPPTQALAANAQATFSRLLAHSQGPPRPVTMPPPGLPPNGPDARLRLPSFGSAPEAKPTRVPLLPNPMVGAPLFSTSAPPPPLPHPPVAHIPPEYPYAYPADPAPAPHLTASHDLQSTLVTLLANAQNLSQLLNNLNSAVQSLNGAAASTNPNPPAPPSQAPPPPAHPTTTAAVLGLLLQSLGPSTFSATPNNVPRPVNLSEYTPMPVPASTAPLASMLWNPSVNTRNLCSGPPSLGSSGSRGSSPLSSSPSTSPSSTDNNYRSNSTGLVTPIGQKRKYNHVLPSPEPSPDSGYIGQHSQGLGGHYADSYLKRKRRL